MPHSLREYRQAVTELKRQITAWSVESREENKGGVTVKFIKKICTIIDSFTELMGRIFSFIVFVTMFAVLFEVIARKVFNHPQIWTMDIILYTYGMFFALVCAYGFLNRSYVRVDIISSTWPPIVEHIIHLVTYFVFMWPFTFWIMYRSFPFAINSVVRNERNYSVWLPPLWPVKAAFCAGLVLLNIQAISETLKEIMWIYEYFHNGKQEPPAIGSLSVFKPIKADDELKEVHYE